MNLKAPRVNLRVIFFPGSPQLESFVYSDHVPKPGNIFHGAYYHKLNFMRWSQSFCGLKVTFKEFILDNWKIS